MGLFNRLGRRIGEFEQKAREAKEASMSEAEWACGDCGSRFFQAREACPDCGSAEVVELDEATDPEGSADAAGSADDDRADGAGE